MKTLSEWAAYQADIEKRISYWLEERQTAKTIAASEYADMQYKWLAAQWRESARQVELLLNSQVGK